MLDQDKRVTYSQTEEILDLNPTAFRPILKDHIHVTKFCYIWMPRSLTED